MIFVTVGTHEQQFNRLIKAIDELKRDGEIEDEIVIQIGYSTYEPMYCKWEKMFEYNEVVNLIKEADIVISHGGPATFLLAIQNGKIPIVFPRNCQHKEHVNNHQIEFVEFLSQRMDSIIPVYDEQNLKYVISNYKELVKNKNQQRESNNDKFCEEIEKIAKGLLGL